MLLCVVLCFVTRESINNKCVTVRITVPKWSLMKESVPLTNCTPYARSKAKGSIRDTHKDASLKV